MDNSAWPVVSDGVLIGAAGVYVLASIFIPKYLKETGRLSAITARRAIHALAGLSVLVVPFLNFPVIAFVFALMMTVVARTSGPGSRMRVLRDLYAAIGDEDEGAAGYLQGPFAYSLAITVLMFAFLFMPRLFPFPIAAILIMMYADPLAAVVGRRIGRIRIPVPGIGDRRTLEGTLTFFVVSLIVSGVALLAFGIHAPGHLRSLAPGQLLACALAMSVSASLLELVSPSKYDDLIVPLGSTAIAVLTAAVMSGI